MRAGHRLASQYSRSTEATPIELRPQRARASRRLKVWRRAAPRRKLARCPSCPKSRPRAAASAARRRPHDRRASRCASRGCAGPSRETLPRALAGQRIDSLERRGKYLLFGTDAGTLLVHLGMSGSLRYLPRAARARPARSHRRALRGRRRAALQRPAPLRQLHADDDAERASAAEGSRPRAARRRVRRRLSVARKPQPPRRDQAAPDERPRRRRRRQHLRERGAVSRGHPSAAHGRPNCARALRAARRVRSATCLRDAIEEGGTTLRNFVGGDGKPGLLPRLAATSTSATARRASRCGTPIERRVSRPARDLLLPPASASQPRR